MPFYVLLDKTEVIACNTRDEAKAIYEAHLAKGHPAVRVASVYQAPNEELFRQVVVEGKELVSLVCVGIPSNYYASDEWKQQQAERDQRRLKEGGWDCCCGEEHDRDVTYCPKCGESSWDHIPEETAA